MPVAQSSPRPRTHVRDSGGLLRLVTAAAGALLLLAACGSGGAGTTASSKTSTSASGSPAAAELDSMVVMGHSGATGYDSAGGKADSWATGTNPAVDSIYLRLLTTHPALKGHNYNVAVNGSTVDDLVRQANAAVAEVPLPDLFLIQSVDNDIQCDGSDDANYARFGSTLRKALDVIAEKAPTAQIVIVSSPWGTVQNYTEVLAQSSAGIAHIAGSGPCDPLDPSGAVRPDAVAYQQHVIDNYLGQVQQACAAHPQCRYDDGAFRNVVITAADVSPDFDHATVAGHAKLAAAVWPIVAQVT